MGNKYHFVKFEIANKRVSHQKIIEYQLDIYNNTNKLNLSMVLQLITIIIICNTLFIIHKSGIENFNENQSTQRRRSFMCKTDTFNYNIPDFNSLDIIIISHIANKIF